MALEDTIATLARDTKLAARQVANLSTTVKDRVLLAMADGLLERKQYIQEENEKDLAAGREKGSSAAMLDRLALSDKVIESMVTGLREVAALPDPVGEISEMQAGSTPVRSAKKRGASLRVADRPTQVTGPPAR